MHREARIANYVLAALSGLSLLLLSLPLSAPVEAFKACAAYLLNPVAYYGARGTERFASVPSNMRALLAADAENRQLRERIKKDEWTQAEKMSLKLENERLRAELGLKAPEGRSPVWAHVMERDPVHWYGSITIDAGRAEGLMVNAPVLGQVGESLVAIGRIVEVREDSAIVLLLTDPLSSLAAYASSGSTETPTSFEGLLQGQNRARLLMNYLNPDAQVKTGDPVYTSPTSATFPPDVLIGIVAQVFPPDQVLAFQSAEVAPATDASRLKEVMILKTQPAGRPVARSSGKQDEEQAP